MGVLLGGAIAAGASAAVGAYDSPRPVIGPLVGPLKFGSFAPVVLQVFSSNPSGLGTGSVWFNSTLAEICIQGSSSVTCLS